MRQTFLSLSFLFLLIAILIYPLDAAIAQSSDGAHSNSSLINQIAEQNMDLPDLPFTQNDSPSSNTTYEGIKEFWYTDIFNTFFANISQFIRNLFISLTSALCNIVKGFFLNTDLTQINNDPAQSNDLSYLINQLTDTIRGIAIDLLLILFVLSIWRYWSQSSWHGNGSAMSAIARLIFTISTMLAWPKIYQFEIELSNEMITALFPDKNGQIEFLNLIVSNMFNATTNSLPVGGLINISASSTIASTLSDSPEPATVVTLFLLVLLGIILIYELLYVIILKAIQTALMTAQYVFAPFFLVFLSNPVTDNIATSFLRAFVEVSLWNFIWLGLLKILVILLYSHFNPCGKIITVIGVLQLMMQVPQFMSHAKISAASDFVSPHFFAKFLKDVSGFDKAIKTTTDNLKIVLGTDSKKGNHPKQDSADTTASDNFNFTGHDKAIIIAEPPAKNINASTVKDTATQQNQYRDSNTLQSDKAFGPNSHSDTHTNDQSSASPSSTSATSMSSSSGFAFASAISIASATIINSSNGPNSGPPSGSSPSGPGPRPSDPSSNPVNPNPDPKSPDPGNSSWAPQRAPHGRPRPDAGPHLESQPSSGGNTYPTCSIVKSLDENLTQKVNPLTLPPAKLSKTQEESKRNILNQQVDSGSRSFWDPFAFNNSKTSTNSSLFSQTNPVDEHSVSSIESLSQNVFGRSQSVRLGDQSYHIYKRIPGSMANSYFYRSNKSYGAAEPLSGSVSYNLIFDHGNPPTLMGIPPIYPDPNRI